MYTEEEAKEKWCPQMNDVASYTKDNLACNCLGSRCMAWRWIRGIELAALELVRKEDNLKVGYCGLAGEP